jgi:hypothetical protein
VPTKLQGTDMFNAKTFGSNRSELSSQETVLFDSPLPLVSTIFGFILHISL